jgi:hypothetical protein
MTTGTGLTLHVLSESLLKLPPTESESFTISLIVLFPIHIFCEFSELTLSLCFSMLPVVRKTSANCYDHIHTVARHGMRKAKKFSASDGRISAARKQTHALSPSTKQVVAPTVRLRHSTICTYMPGMNLRESLILQAWGSLMTQT